MKVLRIIPIALKKQRTKNKIGKTNQVLQIHQKVRASGRKLTQTDDTDDNTPDDSSPEVIIEEHGLSGGAIAGIVIGSVAGAALVTVGAYVVLTQGGASG
jgi:hypothetical protein